MTQQILDHVAKSSLKNAPDIQPGHTVRVHQRIKEGGKERVQIFEGLVIKVNGAKGVSKTFTVRKVVSGIGVEKIFPLHSSNIVKIEITKKAKIRRAKLYYMRERSGKSARLKEQHLNEVVEIEQLHKPEPEAPAEEEVKVTDEAPVAEAPVEEKAEAATAEAAGETPAPEGDQTPAEEAKEE